MRIDVVTIFPAWFDSLDLSLTGKARTSGLLDIAVHDLRDWTHDRHRTVDDTPYGGGAGMVMKPEPWGEALDALVPPGPAGERPTLVVPTPSGTPFTQAVARELAEVDHMVLACGRYEGIDQRVIDEFVTTYDVRELSLGDFVLNGGEVAAVAIIEAVARLLPGFVGNPASLAEESHEDGLLEYPVYTKPATWRGRDVPEVLLSGDHAAIAAWRHAESVRRTVARRPDLAHPSAVVGLGGIDLDIRPATRADAGELFTLTRACWLQELWANPGVAIPALEESFDDALRGIEEWTTFVAVEGGRIVGATRGRVAGEGPHGPVWDVGRVMVAPDLQGRGLGRHLLRFIEDAAPDEVTTYELHTGANSVDNIRMYKKAGYRLQGPAPGPPGAVVMTKRRR
ncbi:MAG TPA: tRNA (guanosine(37)-N1)-methyltransferase TrmD [Nocardioides sp.]|uniref:tRNA (guanosine(37)-N1)-methyltransferase TrmD n=1 Tax=Nocardioides sp. TaxID=35761 RepID=UPI002F3E4B30